MSSSPSSTQQPVAVTMPQMGISVSEGTILEWRKSVGDAVEADETICDVTTDKVDVEIPCPATGVLAKILAEPGQTLPVGEPIAEIDTGAVEASGRGAFSSPGDGQAPRADDLNGDEGRNGTNETDRSGFISPVVRRMADEHEVDLANVEGRGVGGRIRKKDVLAHLETAKAAGPKPS
ncbi:MAG: E3 binding domain-containing protein, partial [Actinomycetota bacterium]|nr:E3 binding domain-containing protein [Actinomycetota bacterium]